MAKRLDRKKDFGEIFGGGRRRYEQAGCYFDVHGELVEDEQPVSPKAEAKENPAAEVKTRSEGGHGKEDGKKAEDRQSSLLDDQLAAQAQVGA